MRRGFSLAGEWEFQLDPDGTLDVVSLAPSQTIAVPLPWQVAYPELQHYSGYAWYRHDLELDDQWLEGELLLHFGAVDYWCQVFVNGQCVAEHEGGYTPITVPIRRFLQRGTNSVALRVYDSAQIHMSVQRWPSYSAEASSRTPPFDANNVPHGKQEWYLNVGGIWQDVTVTAVPVTYIDHVAITPDIHTGQVRTRVEIAGLAPSAGDARLRVHIVADDRTWEAETPLLAGQLEYEIALAVDTPRLWQVEDPYLYTATMRIVGPGSEDELTTRFGFREITTRDGFLVLNGKPFYLLSALDQDLYPHTIYTVPSEEFLRDGFRKAKEMGLNCLRCHIKPPDPRYLDLADEMGLLIWAEIPSWRTFTPKGTVHANQLSLDDSIKERVDTTLREMIRRDYNHPSLIIWTIVNEDWGTALPLSAADRAWVATMYERCKQLDPTRLAVDNSACPHPWGPNIHVRSDLDDFHVYANIPDQASSFEQALEQYNLRPLWTYSQHGDADRNGQEPLILSEFGNWGLPSVQALREAYGGDPPWFEIGPWWAPYEGEPGWAKGVVERFHQLGMDTIWPDYEAFAVATQWHQWSSFKWEIETMRRLPAIAGYVITEFTDAYWEANGMLDFLRNPKVFCHLFSQINAPDVIVPRVKRYAFWDDEEVAVDIYLSHFSTVAWSGASLHWRLTGTYEERIEIPEVERGKVATLKTQRWLLPAVTQIQMVQFELQLRSAQGDVLARNTLDLLVLPAAARRPRLRDRIAVVERDVAYFAGSIDSLSPAVTIGDPDISAQASPILAETEVGEADPIPAQRLAYGMRQLGYRTTKRLTPDVKVAVSSHPTAELLQWVREGGDLLFISSGASPFYWVQGRGGIYSGGWITSFSWMRPEVHHRLAVASPLSLPFRSVIPRGTMLGLPVEDKAVQGDFLAGMIAGWIRHPAIHTVQFRYGRGRVIMTTFGLEQALGADPVADAMLHDLIEHLHSDACQPVLTANGPPLR